MGFLEKPRGLTFPKCYVAAMPGARCCQQSGVSIGAKQCDSCGAEVAGGASFSAACGEAA